MSTGGVSSWVQQVKLHLNISGKNLAANRPSDILQVYSLNNATQYTTVYVQNCKRIQLYRYIVVYIPSCLCTQLSTYTGYFKSCMNRKCKTSQVSRVQVYKAYYV